MNRGIDLDLEALDLDDAASYELLARGDTLGVFQLDGGPMRSLLKLMKPDNFEDISAVLALYRPGPDGRQRAHRLRAAQERDPGSHPDPPGARGTARRNPRRDLRPDRVPGAGHGRGAEARRLYPRPGRHPAPRHGQEEEIRAGQAVRRLLPGHAGQRLLHGRGQDPLGHPAAVLRLRLQQGALGRLRRDLLLDRLPEGPLCAGVHGRPADLAWATTRTSRRSTSTNAGAWASRCCRRTSTSPR